MTVDCDWLSVVRSAHRSSPQHGYDWPSCLAFTRKRWCVRISVSLSSFSCSTWPQSPPRDILFHLTPRLTFTIYLQQYKRVGVKRQWLGALLEEIWWLRALLEEICSNYMPGIDDAACTWTLTTGCCGVLTRNLIHFLNTAAYWISSSTMGGAHCFDAGTFTWSYGQWRQPFPQQGPAVYVCANIYACVYVKICKFVKKVFVCMFVFIHELK